MAKIIVKTAELEAAKAEAGFRTDDSIARAAGIHPTQYSRVMAGRSEPGNKFIAGILDVFGMEAFPQLFAKVSDDEGIAA